LNLHHHKSLKSKLHSIF